MSTESHRTAAQVGRANRYKGARRERQLADWLRRHGFPHAERAVRTGYRTAGRTSADPGDITGTPGLVWQVTDRADIDQDAVLAARLADTEQQRAAARAAHGLLVVVRRGAAGPGDWWCWLGADDIAELIGVGYPWRDTTFPVRARLADVVAALVEAGYGTAPEVTT